MRIKKLSECRPFTAGDGSRLREIFNPKKHEVRCGYSLAWARVKPGRGTIRHRLKNSEVYYILKGRGKMRIGRQERAVSAGDTVYIPPRAVQSIKNIGKVDLEFLCIVSPAWEPSCETILKRRY